MASPLNLLSSQETIRLWAQVDSPDQITGSCGLATPVIDLCVAGRLSACVSFVSDLVLAADNPALLKKESRLDWIEKNPDNSLNYKAI